jgi:hypothetical protein
MLSGLPVTMILAVQEIVRHAEEWPSLTAGGGPALNTDEAMDGGGQLHIRRCLSHVLIKSPSISGATYCSTHRCYFLGRIMCHMSFERVLNPDSKKVHVHLSVCPYVRCNARIKKNRLLLQFQGFNDLQYII